MIIPFIFLLGLVAVTVLARPYPTEPTPVIDIQATPNDITKRKEGSCKSKHLANRDWFNLGVEAVCRFWFHPAGVQNPDPYRTITVQKGISAYSDLPAYDDGKKIRYHFNVKVETLADGREHKTLITEEQCQGNFKNILLEGKSGGEYCEVEGTSDTLAQGGRFDMQLKPKLAKLVYQVKTEALK